MSKEISDWNSSDFFDRCDGIASAGNDWKSTDLDPLYESLGQCFEDNDAMIIQTSVCMKEKIFQPKLDQITEESSVNDSELSRDSCSTYFGECSTFEDSEGCEGGMALLILLSHIYIAKIIIQILNSVKQIISVIKI